MKISSDREVKIMQKGYVHKVHRLPDFFRISGQAVEEFLRLEIIENFIEEPYFEYIINKDLCIGCAKCVAGCSSFGNGSLQLQIRHDLCVNCNECSIARVCPSDAIHRVPADKPYLIKGDFAASDQSRWENPA